MKQIALIFSCVIVSHFSPLNAQDDLKVKYLFEAITKEDYSKISKYLESGVDVNYVLADRQNMKGVEYIGPKTKTPLLKAIETGKPDLVRFLVESGANINQTINYSFYQKCNDCRYDVYYRKPMLKKEGSHSPINAAIKKQHLPIVEYLVSQGADFSRESSNIKQTGNLKLLEFFKSKGMNFNFSVKDLEEAYGKRAYGQKREFAKFLIEKEKIIAPGNVLVRMVESGDTELLKLALDNGSNVNAFTRYPKNPRYKFCALCSSVWKCDLETAKLLIEEYMAKTDVHCTFKYGTNWTTVSLIDLASEKKLNLGKCNKGSAKSKAFVEYLLFAKDAQQAKRKKQQEALEEIRTQVKENISLGNTPEAIKLTKEAFKISKDQKEFIPLKELYNNRCKKLMQEKKWTEANTLAKEALRVTSDKSFNLIIGDIHFNQKSYKKALQFYDAGYKYAKNHAAILLKICESNTMINDYKELIISSDALIQLGKNDHEIGKGYLYQAICLANKNATKETTNSLKQAKKRGLSEQDILAYRDFFDTYQKSKAFVKLTK